MAKEPIRQIIVKSIDNYGGVFVMNDDGKYVLQVERRTANINYISAWQEIDKDLYDILLAYADSKEK